MGENIHDSYTSPLRRRIRHPSDNAATCLKRKKTTAAEHIFSSVRGESPTTTQLSFAAPATNNKTLNTIYPHKH
jgi:hypothetical protein